MQPFVSLDDFFLVEFWLLGGVIRRRDPKHHQSPVVPFLVRTSTCTRVFRRTPATHPGTSYTGITHHVAQSASSLSVCPSLNLRKTAAFHAPDCLYVIR